MNYNFSLSLIIVYFFSAVILNMIASLLTKNIPPISLISVRSLRFQQFLDSFLTVFSTFYFYFFLATFPHDSPYFYPYVFFICLLCISAITDKKALVISRIVTLYAMPIGWILSNLSLLPLTPLESISGSLVGLLLLAGVRALSKKFLGKEGLGQGDIDLLCFIGAFTGPVGCWVTVMTASLLGSLYGCLLYLTANKKEDILLPFGLFLAGSAQLYVIFQKQLTFLFFPL